MSSHRTLQAALLVLSTLSLPVLADSGDAPKSGLYTVAQAASGKVATESSCGICHLRSLRGRVGAEDESPALDTLPRSFQDFIKTSYVPPLAGEEFLAKWKGKTIAELADALGGAMKSFPTAGMDETTFLAITAYVLQMNGAPAGSKELTAPSATMTLEKAIGPKKVAAR